jgi:hypothetical protein
LCRTLAIGKRYATQGGPGASGRAKVRHGDFTFKWVAVRHSRAWLKIEGKGQRILQAFHYVVGKFADLAFEAHSWQRSQALNIGY